MRIDALQCSRWDREVFEELRDGSLDCVVVTAAFWENAEETLESIGRWRDLVGAHSDLVALATSVEEVERISGSGRTALVLGFQNTSSFDDSIRLVELFALLGVRVVQLTYNIQNAVGGSCYEALDSGLTRFGAEVVDELNRCGVLIDLSHVGPRTSLEAIERSRQPVAVTHAVPADFHPHPRNKSSELLRALAARGGMLGCAIYSPLIGGAEVTIERWSEMVARAVELMGVEGVGIGTDMTRKCTDADLAWMRNGSWTRREDPGAGRPGDTSMPSWPAWYPTPRSFPSLGVALSDRGFTPEEVDLILGGNWRRLLDGVWSSATAGRSAATA
ncbi:MAG: rane dipeptidase [Solirubrobacterales bacterium]|jgi:membrane dipeptidase|nr:rane dipeptidase [Solirubrobacterales bacterium]